MTRPAPARTGLVTDALPMDAVDPPHRLDVAHRSQIALGRLQVRVPQDHLADDFQGSAGPGRIGGGMPAQVVWPQPDVHDFAGLLHDDSGSPIGDGNDPLVGADPLFPNVLLQPIADLVREEDHLGPLTALGLLGEGLPVVDIVRGQLQDFPDAHATAGHEYQHEPVTLVGRAEDDLVDHVL